MAPADRCELHEVPTLIGHGESEVFLRLIRSPISDECQRCAVCRLARQYMVRRLAEHSGQTFPPDESGEAILRKLRAALEATKASFHEPS